MYINERNNEIYEYLKQNKRASVNEIAEHFFISTATVRRVLEHLERWGVVKRVHGGAVYFDNANEIPIYVRQTKNAEEKKEVVNTALKYLPEFSSVFIDNSSTCLLLCDKLNLAHKTVVTNGLQVASVLNKKENVKLYMPAGEIKYNTNAVTGEMACDILRNFRFDLMLCSCAAFDEKDCFEQSQETAILKRIVFQNSRHKILIADKSKFGGKATYLFTTVSAFDKIVTNIDEADLKPFLQQDIRIFNN